MIYLVNSEKVTLEEFDKHLSAVRLFGVPYVIKRGKIWRHLLYDL